MTLTIEDLLVSDGFVASMGFLSGATNLGRLSFFFLFSFFYF
jgi:hypothetical protein